MEIQAMRLNAIYHPPSVAMCLTKDAHQHLQNRTGHFRTAEELRFFAAHMLKGPIMDNNANQSRLGSL
jgi:hypothetical protein